MILKKQKLILCVSNINKINIDDDDNNNNWVAINSVVQWEVKCACAYYKERMRIILNDGNLYTLLMCIEYVRSSL